jgi:hypothetical protein
MNLWNLTSDGQLQLNFHPGQTRAWQSERRFTFVLAGTQSGKTSWGPWWLWKQVRRCGRGDYLAVTSSYDLFKLKLLPALRETFEYVLRIGRYWSGDRILELADPETGQFWAKRADDPMWGRIILRSAESGGGLESASAHAAWLDEAGQDSFTLDVYQAVLRRLSLSQGPILGTTTIYNLGWLKHEIYDPWLAGAEDIAVIQFPSYLNPAFPRAEYERMRSKMQRARFLMFYDGQFARPAGMIYGCFDDRVHVVPRFAIPAEWPRHVGLDFGGANTALVWLAENPVTRCYYLYRESLGGDRPTKDHAADALAYRATENIVGWYGGAPGETQQRMDWNAAGVWVAQPPISDVESGIDKVYALLAEKRLFIFEDCRGVRDEIGSYKRKVDGNGQVTNEIENKRTFHRLDALRYVASGVSSGASALLSFYQRQAQAQQAEVANA